MQEQPTTKELTPEQFEELIEFERIEKMEVTANIESQKVHDKICKDEMLMEKVDMILTILKCEFVDGIEKGIANKKLRQLINRF